MNDEHLENEEGAVEPILADGATPAGGPHTTRELVNACIEMTKPRISAMVLVTATFAYVLATGGVADPLHLLITLLGVGLAGSGASVLNQYLERDTDARMERTRNRPLPAGVLTPHFALNLGVVLATAGCMLLVWQVNLLAAFLTLESTFLYVLVYTPMKRLTWWNTVVGAVPGAMPMLIGWAAAAGSLSVGAWILFAILYVWQFPHFYAIAWMFREDYRRGGLKMLSVVKPDGRNLAAQTIVFSILLIPVTILPYAIGMSGLIYLVGGTVAALYMAWHGIRFALRRDLVTARKELIASIVYLPALLVLIAIDFTF